MQGSWLICSRLGFLAAVCWSVAVFAEGPQTGKLIPAVQQYVDQRIQEFGQIDSDRKLHLEKIAGYVKEQIKAGKVARLTFICTHNSRRSHMSQIWAAVAACNYEIEDVATFSGGTEATAFNPRAIAAIQRAGLKIEIKDQAKTPRVAVSFRDAGAPLICFSKVYSDATNPQSDFCAVMTCSQADQNCPTVKGSNQRIALPFDDPKVADGTPMEAAKYDERCAQICREMLYLFSTVK